MSCSRVFFVLLAMLGASACHRSKKEPPSSGPSEEAPVESGATPTVEAAPTASAPRDASPPPIEAGPAKGNDDSVTKEARERAVLDLLAGGEPATRLPRSALDPGETFDEMLRERVSPEIWVSKGLSADHPPRTGPHGDVRLGPITGDALKPSNAERVVTSLRPGFRACYNQGLQSDPTMAGTLVVSTRVSPNGEVAMTDEEKNSGISAAVSKCIESKVRNAQFEPTGQDGSTFKIALTFTLNPNE